MQNFIVLGYIPGTNYQTTFAFWIYVDLVICALVFSPQLLAAVKRMNRYTLYWRVAHSIRKLEPIAA